MQANSNNRRNFVRSTVCVLALAFSQACSSPGFEGEPTYLDQDGLEYAGDGYGEAEYEGSEYEDSELDLASSDVGGPQLGSLEQALTLRGGADNDRLEGKKGDDVLSGGGGNDRLFGRAGDDRLNGGTGNDRLSGGKNTDVFTFKGNFGNDRVFEKSGNKDVLVFPGVPFASATGRRVGNDVVIITPNGNVRIINQAIKNCTKTDRDISRIEGIVFQDGNAEIKRKTGELVRTDKIKKSNCIRTLDPVFDFVDDLIDEAVDLLIDEAFDKLQEIGEDAIEDLFK